MERLSWFSVPGRNIDSCASVRKIVRKLSIGNHIFEQARTQVCLVSNCKWCVKIFELTSVTFVKIFQLEV